MKLKSAAGLFAAFASMFSPILARAEFPAKVFAPYMYIGSDDHFKLTDCDDACGLKFYTVAFFIARQERKTDPSKPGGKAQFTYSKEPSWDGNTPMDKNLYADQIDAIRQRGGDVIASFGGEAGREMAIIETDPAALASEYQSVIDKYKFTWLDFDIEGDNLDKNAEASQRRNAVLAQLQKKNPGLIISYTLPVDPDGISDASQALLADAAAKGVKVHSANLMVMFFGKQFINKGKSEGELGTDSANKAHEQIQKIDPNIQVGLCPCLGPNGSKAEVFDLDDAKTIVDFAEKTPWVCSLHYWSINDDAARPPKRKGATSQPAKQPWAFARIFMPFTSAK